MKIKKTKHGFSFKAENPSDSKALGKLLVSMSGNMVCPDYTPITIVERSMFKAALEYHGIKSTTFAKRLGVRKDHFSKVLHNRVKSWRVTNAIREFTKSVDFNKQPEVCNV